MFYEEKKEIRKHVRSLGWCETMKLMVETSAQIDELRSTMSWVDGLDGIKKYIKKSLELELAGYKLECCARRIQHIARINQSNWSRVLRHYVLEDSKK